MSTPYQHRRKKDRGAVLIILISTVCMIMLLALFFTSSMRKDSPDTEPEGRGNETDAVDVISKPKPDDHVTANINTIGSTEQQTTAEQTQPTPDTIAPDTKTPSGNSGENSTGPASYTPELLEKTALAEGTAPEDYVDQLVFYGDSTTYGMKAYKVFGSRDTKQVWTPTSGTLALYRAVTDLVYDPNSDTEKSLADICTDNKPEYLIVTLGVNGVSTMDKDYFKTEYQKVIDIIQESSPDTHLILQSIYPVARSYQKQSAINNTKIQAANEWIVELAADNGLPYLNTYSALIGEDGYLPETYQNGDGMHFNETGFAAIMDYVESHPYLA